MTTADWVNIFVISIGILSIITNGVLLLIQIKDPLNFFKGTTTYFIISLALADMITGANACMFGINHFYPNALDYQVYLLSLFWITTQASFLTLLAMSVERFFVVRFPFDSRRWITKKRVCCSIALIWAISAILGGLVLLPPPKVLYVQFSIFTEFFVSVFVIAGLYAFILLRVRKSKSAFTGGGSGLTHKGGKPYEMNAMKTNDQGSVTLITNAGDSNTPESSPQLPRSGPSRNGTAGNSQNGTTGISQNGTGTKAGCASHGNKTPREKYRRLALKRGRENISCDPASDDSKPSRLRQWTLSRQSSRNSQQEKKLTAVVLLLVGILLVTILPYLLVSQIYVGYILFCTKCAQLPGLEKFMFIFFPVELLNFAVNPLIYAWRLPQYRRTLRYLFSRNKTTGNFRGSSAFYREGSRRSASVRTRKD